MRRVGRIPADAEAAIIAALEKTPHATFVARKTGWSYSTVWRVADRAGIELTAGREARGYKRLPAAQRAKIEAALQANPKALQREIAQQTGVSRVTISRIEGGVRRPRRHAPLSAQDRNVTRRAK
jgi:hypothetical protein